MGHRRSCAVIGLGNIGSHAALLVARLASVFRVIVVDFDAVEGANLETQNVRRADVGRPKAAAIGRRLAAAREDLEVVVHARRLEDVPLGELRADVILGCLDSRAARMALNERAVALGIPWVDAGVTGSGLLARVSVLGGGGPCLECAWGQDAYASVETVHACGGAAMATARTAAPAFLGATAAALQVAACSEILRGETSGLGKEAILDLAHGKLVVSSLRVSETCRMAPHRPWRIESVGVSPEQLRLEAAFGLGPRRRSGEERSIQCARGPFATRLTCVACGAGRSVLRLVSSLTRYDRRCRSCGGPMEAAGVELRERLAIGSLEGRELCRSLAQLGARVGDVLTIRAGEATRHFEIAGGRR